MVAYQLIQELNETGKLNLFIRKGLIPLSVLDYKNIYEYYNEQVIRLKNKGVKKYKMQALENTCIKFDCQNDKVYYAIKKMEG